MGIVKRATAQPETENSRAVIGSNRAPLDEQIVIDLSEALEVEGITARIAELLASASRAPVAIETAEVAGQYADLIKLMSAAGKAVEAEREKLNRPILNAQRALKGRADAIVEPLQEAERTARQRIGAYAEAERVKEAAREAEARREADAERQRLQDIENARAVRELREAEVVEVEPEPVAEPAATVRGDYGAKVVATTTWKHRIVNVRHLPDSLLKHVKVIEALDKVIAAQVRGGTREIKGCEIFPETGTTIR